MFTMWHNNAIVVVVVVVVSNVHTNMTPHVRLDTKSTPTMKIWTNMWLFPGMTVDMYS
jgi:hypothetical protein